jgi:hypothetical protein
VALADDGVAIEGHGSVRDRELLYRNIKRAYWKRKKDGSFYLSTQAFTDPNYRISVYRAALCGDEPSHAQEEDEDYVRSLYAGDVRAIDTVIRYDNQTPIEHHRVDIDPAQGAMIRRMQRYLQTARSPAIGSSKDCKCAWFVSLGGRKATPLPTTKGNSSRESSQRRQPARFSFPRARTRLASPPPDTVPLPQQGPVGVLTGESEAAVLLIDRSPSVTLCRAIKATQEVSR